MTTTHPMAHARRSFMIVIAALAAAMVLFAAGPQRSTPLQVPGVSANEAQALINAGALVLDVRGHEQFNVRHLPNAVLLPLAALQVGIPDWLSASRERPIVVYCNRGLSHGPEVTAWLQNAGFTGAVNLTSGIEGWAAAGLPLIARRG